ncbi:MAG TPA: CoA pyrophosphatase [Gammaproteobacteria bacterium]|nr:CoA pyrophosphatase [Gammaproteobacteria bacterium]
MTSSLRFDRQLYDLIKGNLTKHRVAGLQREGCKRAAVAFTLINANAPARIGNISYDSAQNDEAAYILTTRSASLSSHAGQRAYPGGRVDPGETAEQAALRELAEEVGLELDSDSVLGRLDDYATRSGFVITPIVVWGGTDVELVANPAEVELIHRVPLRELLRVDAPLLDSIEESPHPVLRMPLGDDWFAAPSAAIAYQFREVALLGKATRVVHFEQPYFAWQ